MFTGFINFTGLVFGGLEVLGSTALEPRKEDFSTSLVSCSKIFV